VHPFTHFFKNSIYVYPNTYKCLRKRTETSYTDAVAAARQMNLQDALDRAIELGEVVAARTRIAAHESAGFSYLRVFLQRLSHTLAQIMRLKDFDDLCRNPRRSLMYRVSGKV
jgi:hypothetical protein